MYDHCLSVFITQFILGLDHSSSIPAPPHLEAGVVDLPDAGHCVPLHAPQQGAELGGEDGGQHVVPPVSQVHRGGSPPGLLVCQTVDWNKVSHISNVNTNLQPIRDQYCVVNQSSVSIYLQVPILQSPHMQGIINIFTTNRINGHDQQ